MKDKLIAKLKQIITEMKDNSESFIVEINDENKNEIISDLVIPFMQLTDSESVADLSAKLELLVNGDFESVEHKDLVAKVIDVLLEGSEDVESEMNHLVTNAFAVVNKFKELKSDVKTIENKESTGLDLFGEEIVHFMNSLEEGGENKSDEVDVIVDIKEEKTEAVEGEEEETEEVPTEPAEAEGVPAFVVVSGADEVDETPWAEVNQVEIKNLLMEAVTAEAEGAKEAVDEVFGLVRSYDKVSDWQWPHHVVKDSKVVLNANGLKTAALFLVKPTSSKNLSPEERTTVAAHLLKHYAEIAADAPAKLTKLSEGKESTIVINIKEDEMKEFGELFKVDVEDVATYIGLMEALLTDLVNSGIINIESDDANFDESVVSVKLHKQQTEELIKYFDIMSSDITKILNSEFDTLAYKITNEELEKNLSESDSMMRDLESKYTALVESVKTKDTKIENLTKLNDGHALDKTKFEAIINFVKTIDGVDETLIQFISNVVEAEDSKQVNYLLKLGGTFMKASSQRPTFRKVSMINHATNRDFTALGDLLETEDNVESASYVKDVSKTVDEISSMFD